MSAPRAQTETGMKDFVAFDEINVRLNKILNAVTSQIPDGVGEFASFTISSDFIFDLAQSVNYGVRGPWIACNVTNDGSADCKFSVNDGVTKDTIKAGETREIDMKAKGRLYKLSFFPTTSTPVRLAFIR